jgi:hypothetical protein
MTVSRAIEPIWIEKKIDFSLEVMSAGVSELLTLPHNLKKIQVESLK